MDILFGIVFALLLVLPAVAGLYGLKIDKTLPWGFRLFNAVFLTCVIILGICIGLDAAHVINV